MQTQYSYDMSTREETQTVSVDRVDLTFYEVTADVDLYLAQNEETWTWEDENGVEHTETQMYVGQPYLRIEYVTDYDGVVVEPEYSYENGPFRRAPALKGQPPPPPSSQARFLPEALSLPPIGRAQLRRVQHDRL